MRAKAGPQLHGGIGIRRAGGGGAAPHAPPPVPAAAHVRTCVRCGAAEPPRNAQRSTQGAQGPLARDDCEKRAVRHVGVEEWSCEVDSPHAVTGDEVHFPFFSSFSRFAGRPSSEGSCAWQAKKKAADDVQGRKWRQQKSWASPWPWWASWWWQSCAASAAASARGLARRLVGTKDGGATLALCALAVVAASRSLVPFQPSVASSPRSSVSRGGDTIPPAKGALDHVMGSCEASTCLYCHAR